MKAARYYGKRDIRFEEIDLETFFYDDSFRGLPFSSEFFRNLADCHTIWWF